MEKKTRKFDDQELIKNVMESNCSDCFQQLVEKHSGLCFSIGKRYASTCGLDLNELNDNRYYIIYNAIKSFNHEKGSKFSTWLGNQVRFFCLNYKNKNKNHLNIDDSYIDYFFNKNTDDNSKNKDEILNLVKDLFHQISDKNTKDAIYYRYFHNKERILNYAEVAEILNVTPQTVLNWHNKFINFAKKKLTNKENLINI